MERKPNITYPAVLDPDLDIDQSLKEEGLDRHLLSNEPSHAFFALRLLTSWRKDEIGELRTQTDFWERYEDKDPRFWEDYRDFAQLRLAVATKFFPPPSVASDEEIVSQYFPLAAAASSQLHDEIYLVLGGIDALIGPRSGISSKFLLDLDIVQTRLAIIETLLPVFAALTNNPQVEQHHLRDLSKLLNSLTEYELFPDYIGSRKIPTPDSEEDRFELGKQMVNLYLNLTNHPNADCFVLETAVVNSLSICNYPRFDRQQKTELLKETIAVLTQAAIHPAVENVSRDQWALNIMKSLFQPEYPMGEKLTKEDRLSITPDVIDAVATIVSKGEKELYDYDIRRVFETLKTAVFADEYSDEEKLALLTKAMPVLKLLAEKHPQRETINQFYSLLDFTPDEDGLGILTLLVDELISAFDEVLEEGWKLTKGEKRAGKIAAKMASSPKLKEMRALIRHPDQFTYNILRLNPAGGLGEYDMLMGVKEFLDYLRQRPKLEQIPQLILPLEPENETRQALLAEIEAMFKIIQEKAADDSVVQYLLPPLQTFYWLYQTLPYQKPPAK